MHRTHRRRRTLLARAALACACVTSALTATSATAGPPSRPAADDPQAPVPALSWRSPLAGRTQGLEAGAGDWRAVNAAVAEFPRGHADIVQWEARAASAAASNEPRPPGTSNSIAPDVHLKTTKP